MNEYKSVQDLIVKAALYDRVSTTISADEMIGGYDVLKFTFSRDGRYSSSRVDLMDVKDHERMTLYCLKEALHKLLWSRYEEIEVEERTHR